MTGRLDEIRDALDNPAEAPDMAAPGDTAPETGNGSGPDNRPFPPDCPIVPLGTQSTLSGAQTCYYLNWNGQIVGLEAGNRHGKNGLIHLFGPAADWLWVNFPQWSKPVYEGRGAARVLVKPSEIVGFDQAEASEALIKECVRRGIFDPAGKVRGAGAHRQRGGGLVLHCGDALLASRHYATTGELRDWRWHQPGMFEGFVYTAASPIPRPWHDQAHPSAAQRLQTGLLGSWNFKRPLLDQRLLLGAIGASLIGGALHWRPNIWITGARGTGKSTLNGEHGVLDQLLGEGQFRTGNASAAAIRQSLQNSTVPVFFDEIEASADNRRVTEVIELARIASSGGKMHRGGQDHAAHEFTLRSCFWFSSINIPPLEPQDRSRLTILELKPLPKGAAPPQLDKWNLPRLGRELLQLMIEGWPRLEETRNRFQAALAASGHDARACDQIGTLLACAEVLTSSELPDDEEIDLWVQRCRPDRMQEISDETPDHVECLYRLLTSAVQARGGDEREALSSWIGAAVAYQAALPIGGADEAKAGDEKADRRLQNMGLKLVNARWIPGKDGKPGRWGSQKYDHHEPGFLAIANRHQELQRFYKETKWQGGVWKQSLGRFPGAIEGVDVKFGHAKDRAVLVPLHLVLDEDELPAESQADAWRAWWEAHENGAGA